jgi:hypothetical protein
MDGISKYTPKSQPQQKSTQETPKDGRVGAVRTHARHSRVDLQPIDIDKARAEFEEPSLLTTRQTPLLNDLMESLTDLNANPDVIFAKASKLYHAAMDRSLIKDALAEEVRKLSPKEKLVAGDKVGKLERLDLRIYYFLKDAMEAATK